MTSQDDNSWMGDPSKPLEGFKWRQGMRRETTGIMMWSEPFIVNVGGREVSVGSVKIRFRLFSFNNNYFRSKAQHMRDSKNFTNFQKYSIYKILVRYSKKKYKKWEY